METPYSRISEVKEALDPDEANGLLQQGFQLIKVMEKYTADTNKQFNNIVYVLGRTKSSQRSHAIPEDNGSSQNHTDDLTIDPTLLECRPWKKYANGSGEWTFYLDRNETLLPDLAGAREFIERLKSGEELTIGNHKYRIKDKFLKRFPATEPIPA
jgi:hypothetical protein